MDRAVSVSLGDSSRDHQSEIELLGRRVHLQRIGTDGDPIKAAELFESFDGKVSALGVGGADLGVWVADDWYPLHSVQPMVANVHRTPVVDGSGLKSTVESSLATTVGEQVALEAPERRVLVTSAVDRWGMAASFVTAGYQCIFGDLMFALGLPIPLRSLTSVRRLASAMLPILGRLPIAWLYPTGDAQRTRQPRWQRAYEWANVIAGDFHYIQRHMPDRMSGKIIVTNSTTEADVVELRRRGVRCLITSTPRLDGRTYGTNLLEAGLVAASGKRRALSTEELADAIRSMKLEPTVSWLESE